MEKMFIYVLDQAVTVSVVILAVILARLVLRRAREVDVVVDEH